jgi:hypothetical protein
VKLLGLARAVAPDRPVQRLPGAVVVGPASGDRVSLAVGGGIILDAERPEPPGNVGAAVALFAADQVHHAAADLVLVIIPGAALLTLDLDRQRAVGPEPELRFGRERVVGLAEQRPCDRIRMIGKVDGAGRQASPRLAGHSAPPP